MRGKDPVSSLRILDTVVKESGIQSFVVVNPRKDWRSITKRLAPLRAETKIQILDIGTEFERIEKINGYSSADLNLPNDPHPTILRHRIYGELMASRLAGFISVPR